MREIELAATLKHLIDSGKYAGNRRRVANDLGITPAALSQYLKGQTRPSLENLVAIADLFDVSLDYLMFGEDSAESRLVGRYMEAGFAASRAEAAAEAARVAKIGTIIAEQIASAAQAVAKRPPTFHGMLDHIQALELERYSKHSIVVVMNLDENLRDVDSEFERGVTAGGFLAVVADNLRAGRSYSFVLSQDMSERESRIQQFRDLLRKRRLTEAQISECKFTVATDLFYVGFGLLHLDVDAMRRSSPVLFNFVESYISHEGWIGYTELASNSHFTTSLMDADHRRLAELTVERLTRPAKGNRA
ncbi:helix-turn-helix transcriptional regulator [Nocardia sp. 2]|uniref:Helix-turn-helix transcriptional regulator n=1 Tax=Nocardia acididurans TaxID=2802282 RepID=A0ABS1M055_9NOCA|nr:helix-turn-helix transcriptional regulator [Nocardia acididurans]MBL1074047.1 helix-turn-helix transcriptional regulator [Nocardia acididurans]